MSFIHEHSLKNAAISETNQSRDPELNRKIILSGHDIISTSFIDCCVQHLHNIARSEPEPLYVGLSGGIDSEAVAWLLHREHIPFTAVILKFKNGLNKYDIEYGESWAQKRKIPIRYIEIDIEKFFNSEDFLKLASRYQCNSPQIVVHMALAREMGSYFIFAGNPMKLMNKSNSYTDVEFAEPPGGNFLAIDRMAEDLGQRGTSCFFADTPKQIISSLFAINPFINSFFEEENFHILAKRFRTRSTNFYCHRATHWVSKYLFYFSQGFQLGLRPTKYTGFEMLQEQIGHEILGNSAPKLEVQFAGLLEFNRRYRDQLVAEMPEADSLDIVADASFRDFLADRVRLWQSEWQSFSTGKL